MTRVQAGDRPEQAIARQTNPAGRRDEDRPRMAGDSLSPGVRGQGLVVEIVNRFLWLEDKTVFELAPNRDGELVFSQFDGKGQVKGRKILGDKDGPIKAVIDVKAGVTPFLSREVRVEVERVAGEYRVRVSDPGSGRVLQEVTSR